MNTMTAGLYRSTPSDLRDRLIMENIDFVGRILSTMSIAVDDEHSKENLISAGTLGLVEAANKFDASKGVPFRTFAFPRIRGAIVDELRAKSPLSQNALKRIGMVRRAYERIEPPVTPEKLAEATDLTLDQVGATLEALRFESPEDWNDLSDTVHGSWRSDVGTPQYDFENQELVELLAEAIEGLGEQERLVLTLYYWEELNLAEIGAALDLSESRISRVLAEGKFRVQEIIRCKTQ